MNKYKCNEKLSEKESTKAIKPKLAKALLAGTLAVTTIVGAFYSNYRDDVEKSHEVQEINIPDNISYGSHNEPVFTKFMEENIDDFVKIKKDVLKYKELHDKQSRTENDEKEMEKIIDKINNEYGEKIERLSLETATSKLADVYHISPMDIVVKADLDKQKLSIKNSQTGKVLLDPSSELLMKDTLIDLVNLENNSVSNNIDKSKHANNLTILFGKTLEMGSKTYKISRNNQLLEIDMKDKDKAEHDER